MENLITDFSAAWSLIDNLQGQCQYAQHDLDDNKQALILYCQQFAFAPEMVPACAGILTCGETQLHYDYGFPGNYVHEPSYASSDAHHHFHDYETAHHDHYEHHEPEPVVSSHGIDIIQGGGNVYTAPGTNAELAATAVSAHESAIQVNGNTYIVDHDEIDTNKVEVACDVDDGCALIPDDGNPHNDIIPNQPPQPEPTHLHPEPHYHPEAHYHPEPQYYPEPTQSYGGEPIGQIYGDQLYVQSSNDVRPSEVADAEAAAAAQAQAQAEAEAAAAAAA